MKLPVFSAFAASIAYVVTHFLTMLRISWLPALLLMAVFVYVVPSMLEAQMNMAMVDSDAPDQAAMMAALGQNLKAAGYIYLASAIFYPMLIAGVLRHVVRGEAPRLPFYLWFGGDEFRILISYILLVIMAILLSVVGMLAIMVVGIVSAMASQTVGGIIILVLSLAFGVAIVWFMLRMSVVFPASVGERTIGIARSWSLTKGSAWSLFFYWLLWMIILIAMGVVYVMFTMGEIFSLIPEMIAAGADEAAMQELEQKMLAVESNLYDRSSPAFWPYIASTYLYTVVSFAFSTAASGVAYRYLASEQRGS